jgi:hypothetical protein
MGHLTLIRQHIFVRNFDSGREVRIVFRNAGVTKTSDALNLVNLEMRFTKVVSVPADQDGRSDLE